MITPFLVSGVLSGWSTVSSAAVEKLSPDWKNFIPVTALVDIDMRVDAHLCFGTAAIPFSLKAGVITGPKTSHNIRITYTNGVITGSLSDGGVWLEHESHKGAKVWIEMNRTLPGHALIWEEAKLFFEGALPRFDGHLDVAFQTLSIIEEIRRYACS